MHFVYQESLKGKHSWEIPLLVKGSGVLRLCIMSSLPVDVFLTDLRGRDAYRKSEPYKAWYKSPPSQIHSDMIALLPGGWFVIVVNRTDEDVKVSGEGTFGEFD